MLYYLSNRELPTERSDIDKMSKKAHLIQQLNMCQAFSATGEEVCFVGPGRGTKDPSWDLLSEYYGLSTRFDLKAVPAPARNYSFPNYPIPDTNTQAMTYWLLYKHVTGGFDRADVIYSRSLLPTQYFLSALARLGSGADIPVWFEQHQPRREVDETLGSRSEFYEQLDGVVCISDVLKRLLVEDQPIEAEDVFVAHDGVDLRAYEERSADTARERVGFDAGERVVMYTGHLYPGKDVESLVRAAAEFDATCHIVGGYDEDVSRIRSEVSIPDNVTFTGFVPPSEIPTYQLAADVLVATVADKSEMAYFSPLKLFEYMAAAKPIVMSRKPEYEEVLSHGKTGLFVEPESVSGLASSVQRLLSDPTLRAELGRQAREEATQYDWRARARSIRRAVGHG